jgi:hypothetical protein
LFGPRSASSRSMVEDSWILRPSNISRISAAVTTIPMRVSSSVSHPLPDCPFKDETSSRCEVMRLR